MKKVFIRVKCILLAPFILYLYNLVAVLFGYIIPINFFSVLFVGFLGIPGLVALLLLKILAF